LESAIDGLSDPGNYQRRFRELSEESGCHVHDLLPDLLKLPHEERVKLWSYSSGHLSAFGHQVIARLMTPLVERFMSAAPGAPVKGTSAGLR
jgi:hypothetical protein